MEPSPTAKVRVPWRRSPLLAGLLGWLLPGLGHLYVGRPVKASLFLLAILPAFLFGWHLTGYTIVDPERYRLDYAAQILLGGPTLLVRHVLGSWSELTSVPLHFDVGRLYVAVAGLLNLVAACDAVGDAILHNRRALEIRAQARREAREVAS